MHRIVKKVRLLLVVLNFLSLSPGLQATECGFQDGGYCLNPILKETLQAIEKSSSEKAAQIRAAQEKIGFGKLDGMVLMASMVENGTYLYIQYEMLWNRLIEAGVVSESERKAAFEEAADAGGTKIGGVNLVVLGARTLQKLVDLKFITLEQAQGILEQSRRR